MTLLVQFESSEGGIEILEDRVRCAVPMQWLDALPVERGLIMSVCSAIKNTFEDGNPKLATLAVLTDRQVLQGLRAVHILDETSLC